MEYFTIGNVLSDAGQVIRPLLPIVITGAGIWLGVALIRVLVGLFRSAGGSSD